MSTGHLIYGQAAALALALLFLVIERRRMSWTSAGIEGFRLWGFMAISMLTVWLAVRTSVPEFRIGLALLSPVLAALLVNNIYLALLRRIEQSNER